jgi:hypothetical protein
MPDFDMFEMSSSLEFPLQRHAMTDLRYRNREMVVVRVQEGLVE